MSNNKIKLDTVLFAAAMITVSGACLAYNIRSVGDNELTASLSELAVIRVSTDSAVSDASAANLEYMDAVAVSVMPSEPARVTKLLPPVIVPMD